MKKAQAYNRWWAGTAVCLTFISIFPFVPLFLYSSWLLVTGAVYWSDQYPVGVQGPFFGGLFGFIGANLIIHFSPARVYAADLRQTKFFRRFLIIMAAVLLFFAAMAVIGSKQDVNNTRDLRAVFNSAEKLWLKGDRYIDVERLISDINATHPPLRAVKNRPAGIDAKTVSVKLSSINQLVLVTGVMDNCYAIVRNDNYLGDIGKPLLNGSAPTDNGRFYGQWLTGDSSKGRDLRRSCDVYHMPSSQTKNVLHSSVSWSRKPWR